MPKIKPEVYSEYLRGLKLHSVRMSKLEAELFNSPASDAKLSFSVDFDAGECEKQGFVCFTADFAIDIISGEEKVARVRACYEVLNIADEKPPEGFIDVFGPMNLSRLVYPFFREVVAGATAKMELPTLFVPLNIFGGARGKKADKPKSKEN